ncbi:MULTISPECIES: ACT domain-containing protein [Modestobacter]|uniref:Amino acid-binding protein n=1 Tax=Modestobacter caceresii TaxID=1522368 RepID=A0A098Y0Z5_9ACTN|nr:MULTISPECIES: ACT domain-containing protein [Modestobacter]KGH44618.1 amino acid-binding protein [Modestobacter caceresii]
MSYLLRLVVPDRPGTLGAVATALGQAGIDIVSVDVLERGNGVAVDDVVVELPADRVADSLITAATAVPGVQVESLRPFAGPMDTHRELELLEALTPAGAGTAKVLAAELPRVFRSGWAVVLAGSADQLTVLAASAAAPSLDSVRPPWLPLTTPLLLPSDGDWVPLRWQEMAVEMMAAPLDPEGTAVLLGRSGGPVFRRSELLRLAHLTGLAATVARLPPP